ncbi:MAG: hypothetical protein K0Q68_1193 [Moraxellaceae bacterium]|jgi:hypothetical protein|nr:hypothetical protein [Moraxellaceae bacterium]
MRRLLLALAASISVSGAMIASVSSAAPAPASNPAYETVKILQQLETTSYQTATSFFLYSVLNRDPQQLKITQGHMATGDALVLKVGNPAINTKWNALKQAISSAKFTSEGMAENRSLVTLDIALTGLTQAVRTTRMEQRLAANISTDKMADMLYDQHVLMQTMTSAYLRNAADYFGGSIVQSELPPVEIDKLASKFQTQLDQLNRHYAKNPAISVLLREVVTKWTFIRGSFINYNENNVPFIVGRYNDQITERLLLAYEKTL